MAGGRPADEAVAFEPQRGSTSLARNLLMYFGRTEFRAIHPLGTRPVVEPAVHQLWNAALNHLGVAWQRSTSGGVSLAGDHFSCTFSAVSHEH
ncbi:MAG: hypothetical protein H7276_16855 [Caulobacter sp.]|nr:hypothetical protein [Vitreoscilla sp.]